MLVKYLTIYGKFFLGTGLQLVIFQYPRYCLGPGFSIKRCENLDENSCRLDQLLGRIFFGTSWGLSCLFFFLFIVFFGYFFFWGSWLLGYLFGYLFWVSFLDIFWVSLGVSWGSVFNDLSKKSWGTTCF